MKNTKEITPISWVCDGVLYYSGNREYSSGHAKQRRRSTAFKFEEAYRMRRNPTPAEARMWDILKRQVMPNFPYHGFYRQCVLYGYILDFYCPKLRLAIEVDGGIHDDQKEYDRLRNSHLSRHGIEVRRFQNAMVFNDSEFVASELCRIMQEKTTPWYAKVIKYFGRLFSN